MYLSNLSFGIAASYTLTADSGTYVVTGADATFSISYTIGADSGSYTVSGAPASLLHNKLLTASSGQYLITGTDASLVYTPSGTYILTAFSGEYNVTGQEATLSHVISGAYNIIEYFPTSSTVTIGVYDPETSGLVSLVSDICPELGTSGLFVWNVAKLTTQPSTYKEYGYIMTDGLAQKGGVKEVNTHLREGVINEDNFLINYIIHENMGL